MIRFGHSSPTFCHDGIEATARRIHEAGFDVWEIVGEGGHAPFEHRRELQDALGSYDLVPQLHAPLSDCNLGSLVPSMWKNSLALVERALRGAAALNIRVVTIHPGNHSPLSQGHYGDLHEATRKALRRLDRVGTDLGLTLCLENMATGWAFGTDSVVKLDDLIQGTSFSLCLDIGHAHVAKRLAQFERRPKRFSNVHVHDNRGDVDAHLGLGEGTVPWKRTLGRLVKGGYRGTFVVESKDHASGGRSLRLLRNEFH